MMSTGKNYSILSLKDGNISCLVSNNCGYVCMTENGDITLEVEAYDGMYDPDIDGMILYYTVQISGNSLDEQFRWEFSKLCRNFTKNVVIYKWLINGKEIRRRYFSLFAYHFL